MTKNNLGGPEPPYAKPEIPQREQLLGDRLVDVPRDLPNVR